MTVNPPRMGKGRRVHYIIFYIMARYGFRKSTLQKRKRFSPMTERYASKRNRYATAKSSTFKLSTGQGVTEQHDARTIYRKKTMPYRKKRKWKRFVRQVHYVAEKDMGTQTFLFNKVFSGEDTNGDQIVMDVSLYGMKSQNTAHNDLFTMQGSFNTGNPTAVAGETVDETTKLMYQSAVLDLTIRNGSVTADGTGFPLAANAVMEVDIYELISSKYWNTFRTGSSTDQVHGIVQLFSEMAIDSKNINGTGTGITLPSRGATPFDLPNALAQGKVKILRKTKYQLGVGQTFTYQMRDARRHVITRNAIQDALSCNKPGWTRWIMIIGKGVPGLTYGSAVGQVRSRLDIGVTRKYMCKVEGFNDTRDRFFENT